MLMDYNLLATCEPINAGRASRELWMNLRAIGDEAPKVDKSRVKGLIIGYTSLDPVSAIHGLRRLLGAEPQLFKMVYRVMPVMKWVSTDIESIVEAVQELSTRINVDESFRVTLEKRRTGFGSLEIIEPVAEVLDNPVDLESPDWVILLEVVGKDTGVSVIRSDDVLNIQKERYRLSKNRH
jgi:tRNA acetyltransferase TAN1